MFVLRLMTLLLLASLVAPGPAYAYIDPMSGSLILQALAAGALAALLFVKRIWQRILEIFDRFRRLRTR